MASPTKTRTRSVTSTQMALATLALVASGSFALATIPVQNKLAKNSLVCTAQITSRAKPCKIKKQDGFREYRYTCPNGKKFKFTGACRTEATELVEATKNCSKKKYCVAPTPEIPPVADYQPQQGYIPPAVNDEERPNFPDIAFIGRPEESVSFYMENGEAKMKVHYVNRGSVAFAQNYESSVRVTFLNDRQEPNENVNVQTEQLALLGPGQSFDNVWRLNEMQLEGSRYVKVELITTQGDRAPIQDLNLQNNMVVVQIPAVPFAEAPAAPPAQVVDLQIVDVSFVNNTMTVNIRNAGTLNSTAVVEGVDVRWMSGDSVLKRDVVPLPALAPNQIERLSLPYPEGSTPSSVSIHLDQNYLSGEPQNMSPNIYTENNRNGYFVQ